MKNPVVQIFEPLFELDAKKYSNNLKAMPDDRIGEELMARQKEFSNSMMNGDEMERVERGIMFNCVIQEIMRRGSSRGEI